MLRWVSLIALLIVIAMPGLAKADTVKEWRKQIATRLESNGRFPPAAVDQRGTAKVSFERRGRSDRVALAVIDELNEHVARRTGDDEAGTLGGADDLLAKTGVTTRAGVGL